MSIRPATQDEAGAIMGLLRVMHAEVGMLPLSEDRTRETVNRCLTLGAVLVAEHEGDLVATMGLAPGQWWYSDAKHLSEIWTFVHPQHRRSTHARDMLIFADAMAKDLDVPFFAGVTSSVQTEGKCRLYRRILRPIGQSFAGGADVRQ